VFFFTSLKNQITEGKFIINLYENNEIFSDEDDSSIF